MDNDDGNRSKKRGRQVTQSENERSTDCDMTSPEKQLIRALVELWKLNHCENGKPVYDGESCGKSMV